MERYRSAFVLALLFVVPASGARAADDSGISTQDTEKTVQLSGRATLVLAPGTELIHERGLRLELDGPSGGPVSIEVFRMTRGSVDVRFPADGPRKGVMVRAPRKLAVVAKAGRFQVASHGQTSTVAAFERDALVTVGSDWKPLVEGTARSVGGSASGQTRRILSPPPPSKRAQLLVAAGGTAEGQARWNAVPSAKSYRVRVIRKGADAASVFHAESKSTSQLIRGLKPGVFAVEVAAVDEYGLASAASSAGTIHVVGLVPPAGARSESSRVWLRPGQRAGLAFAKGVEMTYGAASYFVPAPQSVGLFRDQPTRVRLRPIGGTQETAIDLLPVRVTARVALTPALPRWPDDNVRASVEYVAEGTDAPDARPLVSINGRQVNTQWRKQGNTLHAEIPKASGRGPWVVRVEAVDESDHVIGRGFVEVVASAAKGPSPGNRAAVARR